MSHNGRSERVRRTLLAWTLAVTVFVPLLGGTAFAAEGYFPTATWPPAGTTGNAALSSPEGIAVQSNAPGDVFVADTYNSRVMRYTNDGSYVRSYGEAGSSAPLSTPLGVAVDRSGNVYVADPGNHRVVQYDASGNYLRTFGQYRDGLWLMPGDMDNPWGMSVDSAAGLLWVTDNTTRHIQVFDVTADRLAYPNGRCVGAWTDSRFGNPCGIALDNHGAVWVSDASLNNVFKCTINASNPSNITAIVASSTAVTDLSVPIGVEYSPYGSLFVADWEQSRIVKINPNSGFQDGTALQGSDEWALNHPEGVAVDANGSVFVADTPNNRVVKFASNAAGDITPPSTSSNIPDNWVQGPFAVTLTAEDTGTGVATILYGINVPLATTPYTIGSPFTVPTEGTSTIVFRSVDNRGNVENQESHDLRIDNTWPVTHSSTSGGWTKSLVPISLDSSDSLSGVRSIYYKMGASATATYTSQPITSTPINASAQLQYWAVDNAGNQEPAHTITVGVDNIAPVTSSDAATSTYRSAAVVHLLPTDSASGIASTFYSLDGSFPTIPYTGSIVIANEGYTTLRYYSVDNVGNVESPKIQTVTIDGVPPTTTSDIDAAWHTTDVPVHLNATDTFGVARTWYRLPPSDATTYFPPSFVVTGEGYIPVEFGSFDFQDNKEETRSATVKIDRHPPTTIDKNDGQWHRGYNLMLESTDGLSGLDHITYQVNAEPSKTSTSDIAFDIGTDGLNVVQYSGVDLAGNHETTHSTTVKIDVSPPLTTCDATITSPVAHINATDTLSGVANIYYSTDGSDPTLPYNPATGFTHPEGGIVTIKWKAVDAVGNGNLVADIHTMLLIYDHDPPVTTSNIGTSWHASPFRVQLTGFDPGAGVANTFYRVNGGAVTTYTSGGFDILPQGTTTVTYWSEDLLGNVEAAKTETARVDATKPTSSSNRDTDTAWHKDDTTVTISAGDTGGSGVGPIYWRVNGGVATTYTGGFKVTTDGTNTIQYFATDVAGNREDTRTATLKVDRTPPNSSTSVDGRRQKGYFLVDFSAEETGVGGVTTYYKINNGPTQVFSGAFWVYSDGRTDITYWSTDSLGNTEAPNYADVVLDNGLPTTTCTGADGQWHSNDQTITLTAVDALTGIDWTHYRIDGGPIQTYSGPFVISSEGSHTLEYLSQDGVSNVENTKTASVKIDKSGPSSTTNAGSAWYNASWQMTLSASDPYSGVANKFYKINSGATTTYTSGFTLPSDGTNTVKYWAVDNVGNIEASHTASVKRDGTAPVTTSNSDGSWRSGSLIFQLTPTDAGGSGLKSTYYKVNGGATTTYTAGGFIVAAEGTTNIQYWSTDNAGNVETTKTAYVRIDNTAPVTGSNLQSNYSTGTATIILTPNDTGSGVGSTKWRLDGGPWNTGTVIVTSALGDHTIDWYSTDAINNQEGNKTGAFAVTQRFDDNDPRILYRGAAWATVSAGTRYGGAWRTASENATAYVDFSGSRVNLIGSKTPTYGIAKVSVDGGAPEYVDFYSSTFLHQQILWSKNGLAAGPHVLVVEWTGTKNGASGGTMIGIDAIDVAGTLAADTLPPNTTASATGTWRADGSVTVTLTAVDANSYVAATRYTIDGSTPATYTTPLLVAAEGDTTIQYWSIDGAGNSEATQTAHVRLDRTAPVVDDDAPADWTNGPVTVHLTSSDSLSGVEIVLYSLDGSAPHIPYSNVIGISSEGTTTLRYEARDAAGNPTGVRTATICIDDTAPATTDDAPGHWAMGPVAVHLSATDPVSGVASTFFKLDGGATEAYATSVPVSGDGTHTLEYWSVDMKGNVEATKTATVRVDDTTPATADDAPAGWVAGPVSLHLSAADPLSGVAATYYTVDGSAPVPYAFPIVLSTEGTHTITYASVDVNGNTEPTRTTTVRIDHTAPSTSDDAPAVWARFVSVNLTSVDPLSGTAAIHYSIDGKPSVVATGAVRMAVEGTHTLAYSASDNAGNSEATKTVTVRVDDTAPTSASNAAASYFATATISITSSDALSGVAGTSWRMDSGTWTTGTVATCATPGHHTLEFRATDRAGNVEIAQSASFDLLARIEQTDARIIYQGSGWATSANAGRSGGSWIYSKTGPAAAFVVFNGTRIDIIASKASTYGIARVSIDGTIAGTFDLYDPNYLNQQRVFSAAGLADARHVMKVEWTGSRNASATTDYTIGIDALDVAGTLSADAAPPNTTASAIGTWRSTAETVTLSATDAESPVAWTRYTVNGSAPVTYTAPLGVSAEGTTTIRYWSCDAAGNVETTKTAFVRIDKTAPTVSDDGPAGWVSGPVDLHLTAADGASGVAVIRYSTDGSDPTVPYLGPISIAAEGTTTVRYIATDGVGLTSVAHTAVVRIDGTAPTTADDAPASWVDGPVAVHLTPVDTVSGVASTYYSLDGSDAATCTNAIPISAEGTHTLTYWSVDVKGNVESAKTVVVRIDHTAPATADDAPSGWVNGDVTLHLTASDPVSGVSSTFYSLNGGTPTTYLLPLPFTAEGTTTVTYWSSDAKGNVESPKTTLVRIDKTPPATTDDAPVGWTSARAVHLTPIDSLSGLAAVHYRLDGSPAVDATGPVQVSTEGTHTIAYAATDNAGNTEATKTVTLHVDNAPPTSACNAIGSYFGTATISITASDSVSGLLGTAWRLDSGPWTTGTVVTCTTPGPHTLQFRSTDVAGNTEAAKSASFDLLTRVEQTDSRILYQGSGWAVSSNAARSGGSWIYSKTGPAAAYLTFAGSRIDIIASKTFTYGIGRVSIDGTVTGTFDLYDPGYLNQQRVYSIAGLPNTTHVVKIEWTGSRNASATTDYTIGIDALDIAGTLTTDTTPPSTSASASGAWRSTPETVTLTSSDTNTFVASTRYTVNGGAPATYTAPFNVSAEGTTTIEYRSTDGAGNAESTKTAFVRIDKTAPALSDEAPAAWVTGSAAVRVNATDTASGVSTILYSTDGSNPTVPYSAPITVAQEGTTTVRYVAADAVGNATSVRSATVRVDNTAPNTSDDAPIGWTHSPVHLTSVDSLSGVSSVRYSLDGGPSTISTGAIQVTAEGTHILTYSATDAAGNVEPTKTVILRVDMTPPGSVCNAVASYTNTATISISASDTLSGMAGTSWRLDSGNWTTGTVAVCNTAGPHTLQFRSADTAGNVEATQSANFNLIRRVEQNDPRIIYTGSTWATSSNAARSGGDWIYAKTGPAAAYITFTGDRIDIIASKAPTYGIARVSIDGSVAGTFDLYDKTYLNQQRVFSAAGLANVSHFVKVEWTGSRNASATTDYTIGIDAFDVSGQLSQSVIRHEETSTLLAYAGPWTQTPASGRSGGAFTYGDAADSVVYGKFNGTGIDLIASKAPNYGIAQVQIDTGTPVPVSLYSKAYDQQQKVFSVRGLASAVHTITVSWTGSRDASSTGTRIDVDAFDVVGDLLQAQVPITLARYEENSPLIAYAGSWTRTSAAGRSAGAFTYADSLDGVAYLKFNGTTLNLIASRAPDYGIARVSIDGGTPVDVDLYAAKYQHQSKVFVISALSASEHTATISWTGRRNAASSSTRINLDAVDVAGTLLQATAPTVPKIRYEETNSMFRFAGTWVQGPATGRSAGAFAWSDTDTSSVTATFTGCGIDLVGSKNPSYGIANVYIDGALAGTVDMYSSSYPNQAKLFSKSWGSIGTHSITIERTGTKNASSTGTRVNVDALDVQETLQ